MSGESFAPQPITMFGGWVPNGAPEGLPNGMSWDCQDVDLVAAGVRTRPGLVSQFPSLTGGAYINYLKTFPTLNGTDRLLVLDSTGKLYKENPTGTLEEIITTLAENANCRSQTQFGREYLAFSDGIKGIDLPRQFDDTNFDRVSQVGPGAAPTVGDFSFGIASIERTSNVVLVLTMNGVAHTLKVGDQVTIAGVTGYTDNFNGTFVVASVPSSDEFTYAQVGVNEAGNSAAATGTPIGFNVSAGLHQVAVSFITRQGFWTHPSPIAQWTAVGGGKAYVQNIPIGPSNVVARVLMFTAAGQSGGPSFYTIAPPSTLSPTPIPDWALPADFPSTTMYIPDNATTFAVIDFSDVELLAGTSVGYLFDLIELPEQAGVIAYSDRLFWWGERTGQFSGKNGLWLNLTFDGGWNGNVPLGWTLDATYGAGGSKESANVAWGDAYRITGDGATATRGKITQSAAFDSNGVALISANTQYSVRARVAGVGLFAGTLHVNLASVSGAFVTAGLAVAAGSLAPDAAYTEFTAELTAALTSIPSDLVLQVYADGTPSSGGYFLIDNIEIYETGLGEAVGSVMRASRVNDPESYDGVNGLMEVSTNDGQRITNAFVIRNNLYIVKERSLYVTADDGVNEPALWSIQQVSNKVGTPSVHGVAMGDQAAAIAGENGIYVFDGSPPQKISQEVHSDQRNLAIGKGPTWDQVNWAAGQTIWAVLQEDKKRLLVGAPMGAATKPNWALAMYYPYDSESLADVTIFRKFKDAPLARGWAPWTIAANCAAAIARPDGSFPILLGSNDGGGDILALTDGTYSDNGKVIPAYYATYFVNGSDLGLPPVGRKLFGYLRINAEGKGTLVVAGFKVPNRALAISAISRAGNLVTVTTATPHGLYKGQLVDVAGVSDTTYDAQVPVLSVVSATQFTYGNDGGNDSSSGGTVTPLLGTLALSSPALGGNLELPINVSGEMLALRFAIDKTGNPGDWFEISQRVEVYLKLDPWAPFGSN